MFFANPNLWPVLLQILANLDEDSIKNCARVSTLWRRTMVSEYITVRIPKRRRSAGDEVEEWQANYAFHWDI